MNTGAIIDTTYIINHHNFLIGRSSIAQRLLALTAPGTIRTGILLLLLLLLRLNLLVKHVKVVKWRVLVIVFIVAALRGNVTGRWDLDMQRVCGLLDVDGVTIEVHGCRLQGQ